jgi:signal transduction histidine kinase
MQDTTQRALAFVNNLLIGAVGESFLLENHLRGLSEAFAARGAGFAGLAGDLPAVVSWASVDGRARTKARWPWEERPDRLADVLRMPVAFPLDTLEGDGLLLTASSQQEDTSWLLWLEVNSPRVWTLSERAVFALAGQAVVRLVNTRLHDEDWTSWLDRARRQQRLDAAAAVVGRLAHDFNNVLASVLGFTELSLAKASPQAEPMRFLTEAYNAAKHGCKLVERLSLLSKRPAPPAYQASLTQAAAEEEARLQKAGRGNVAFRIELPAGLPALAIDPDSLRLVLGQLLDNAHEAISAAGNVTLSARTTDLTQSDCLKLLGAAAPGPYVEITVADTGRGLSPEAWRRLFADPFFSTKPRHQGLGLAIVYGMVRAHRGGIHVGPGPKQGTVVRVYLPLAEAQALTVSDMNELREDDVIHSSQSVSGNTRRTHRDPSN